MAAVPPQAVAIALHVINARFLTEGRRAALRMIKTIRELLDVVAQAWGVRLDAGSAGVSRFVTHLRHLFVRLDQGTQLGSLGASLAAAIPAAHPRVYRIALRLAHLLAARSGQEISADEPTYLRVRVARLMADHEEQAPCAATAMPDEAEPIRGAGTGRATAQHWPFGAPPTGSWLR